MAQTKIPNSRRRWRKVTREELDRINTVFTNQKTCWNGCTNWALRKLYGTVNVQHRMGHGWYKLASTSAALWKDRDLVKQLSGADPWQYAGGSPLRLGH